MAVHKVIRPNPKAQPERHRPNHQFKAEIFEVLHHLNRGYGVALAAFDKLELKDRLQNRGSACVFPSSCLRDFRHRTETLRALANHDLLHLLAGREQRDATRFSQPIRKPKRRS